ncbi:MAG: lamin tail domain-containing protein [Blastocatellia bacterium]
MKSRYWRPLTARRASFGKFTAFLPVCIPVLAAILLILGAGAGPRTSSASPFDTGTGSVSLITSGSAYTQDFNTLAISGTTNTTLPTGWFLTEQGGGARDNEAYGADSGSSNTGDIYSYGSTGSDERAFGALRSGTLIPFTGASFTNDTGAAITDLAVSYTGEQWRLGTAGRADRIDFQFSVDATNLTTGTYTDVDALDFSSPITSGTAGAIDGNAAANRTAVSATITGVNIAPGATFFIRWLDFDATGADDGLAVDDFSITPSNTPTPTNPTGIGSANPGTVAPGGMSLLTVAVTPGANPTSTGIMVIGDLSSIGGSGAQQFFDDGTNGDVTAGDNTFSFQGAVSNSAALGVKTLPITITDAQARTGATAISLNVQAPALVVISQIYGGGGNSGANFTHDFIELFNRGAAPVDVSGWSVQYTSAAGTSWQVTPLSGVIAPGQYYLVQEASGGGGVTPLPTPDATGSIAMSAASGKVALVNNTTALSGSGCPFSASVVDFIGYGGANCFEGGGAAPALTNTTAARRARGGCRDTNNNSVDFSAPNPNPRNSASPINDCAPPPTFAINAIQGSGAISPFINQEVTTTGVVTARKSNGFFLQTPDANVDADPNTSEGVFVFTASAPAAAVGDAVSVVGTAGEFFGLTQLASSNLDVTIISSGNTPPTPVNLTPSILNPAGALDQLERVEGMRLHAGALVSIAPTNEFGEIFTVLFGVARPLREPGIEISSPLPPGAPCCAPRFDENPERLMVDSDGQLGATALAATSGVTLTNVTGPLDFTFGDYKLLPDAPPAVSANLIAIPAPAPNNNEFTIGSFNLENFFSSNPNFADRLNKASLAIRNAMRSPDIIGMEEVGDIAALTALADKINSDSGAPSANYQAFLIESDNDTEDDIDVGFLVKASRVNVVSVTQEGRDATFINPLNNQAETLNDRPPLILRATIQAPVGPAFPVTVIVNHLRSLIDVDQDPGDGPRVREKRRKQAEFLANLVQSLQSENLVLVGDFNAFQFNDGYVDSIGTIKGMPTPPDQVTLASDDLVNPNLTTLVETLPPDQRYSFIFQGNAQTLDHALVDDEMLQRLTRFTYARNNADFPDSFGADATRPERVSDHDMPVAYFNFPPVNLSFFLHGEGSANNPPTLFLDQTAPTATTAKFKDSAAIKFRGGNSWKEIGHWQAAPAMTIGTLTALSDLRVWIGLKNSDDQGTRFDLRAEVYKNGTLVSVGETYCIQGVTRNPDLAKEVTVSFASFPPVTFDGTGDTLSLKILTRIGTNGAGAFCGGHRNATGLRVYFDASNRPSSVGATF